jgi:hypothetical protein
MGKEDRERTAGHRPWGYSYRAFTITYASYPLDRRSFFFETKLGKAREF